MAGATTPAVDPHQPVYHVTLFVADDTIVDADDHGSLRLGEVTAGYVSLIADPIRRADTPEAAFDVVERFLHRCLDAVGVGRARHTAMQLPCGGVCQPALWPEGAVMCQAVDKVLGCTRHEGHTGPHMSCADLDGGHISHTWDADTEGAVV